MKEDIEVYKKAGIDTVIGKPIDFNQLFSVMEKRVPQGIGRQASEVTLSPVQEIDSILPQIEGIDVEKGLKTWQNAKAFKKALLNFARDYGQSADEILSSLTEGEIDQAQRRSHALRGIAGNLSVTEVAQITTDLDNALKQQKIDLASKLITPLAEALGKTVESLKQLEIEREPNRDPGKPFDHDALKNTLEQMIPLFSQYNRSVLEPLLNQLKEYLPVNQIGSIEKPIERYDFDKGKEATFELAEALNIKLEIPDE
jgi:HPt (histidine-containing phosphotransfer) domain-containing protein